MARGNQRDKAREKNLKNQDASAKKQTGDPKKRLEEWASKCIEGQDRCALHLVLSLMSIDQNDTEVTIVYLARVQAKQAAAANGGATTDASKTKK